MKTIPLPNGNSALVDDTDYPALSKFKWKQIGRYVARSVGWNNAKKNILMHRDIMQPARGLDVDHINGCGLDNRRFNLRICSHSCNQQNCKLYKNNTTGFKGVSFRSKSNRFFAYVRISGKQKHLGSFVSASEAAIAYDSAAAMYYGEYARTNRKLRSGIT